MIIDFTEEGEKRTQAFFILKTLHKTKAGQELIHTEKCLTDKEGYDFPCPICGATMEYDGTVNLPETKTKAQCQACNKQVKKDTLKEKILFGIMEGAFAVWLCQTCFDNDKIVKVNHKRQLKAEVGFCDTCKKVFDADTREELDALMEAHEHDDFKVLQQSKEQNRA